MLGKEKPDNCHSLLITCLCSTLPVSHTSSSGQVSTPVTAWLHLSLLLSLRQCQIVLCYA